MLCFLKHLQFVFKILYVALFYHSELVLERMQLLDDEHLPAALVARFKDFACRATADEAEHLPLDALAVDFSFLY